MSERDEVVIIGSGDGGLAGRAGAARVAAADQTWRNTLAGRPLHHPSDTP
ncbi:hypothetical protein [Streptomyces sp.]|nr:hypothetical protein [Streptomyces sp.]HZF87758.1 hypothetical protein [Streptomyces sp.]